MWLYHKINYQTLFSWKVPIVVSPGYTFACLARCLAVPGSFKSSQMKDTKILQTKNLLLNRPGRQKIKTSVWLTGIGYYKMTGRLCFLLCKQKLKQLAINELSACRNVHASEGVQLVSSNQWFLWNAKVASSDYQHHFVTAGHCVTSNCFLNQQTQGSRFKVSLFVT